VKWFGDEAIRVIFLSKELENRKSEYASAFPEATVLIETDFEQRQIQYPEGHLELHGK
jgi:hypothetical protein